MKKIIFRGAILSAMALTLTACRHDDDKSDDLPNEEMSNVVLKITDAADGTTQVADYQINGSAYPTIKLIDGHTYNVTTTFKNGSEDVTSGITQAKDEHFLIYDFPNSDITLTRTDGAASTRTDGKHVGLSTKWVVNKASNNSNSILHLVLYHEAASVTEDAVSSGTGKVYGTRTGGSSDADATFKITN